MSILSDMGIISSVALFMPIIIIVVFRLFNNRSFLPLAICYLIVSVQNLMAQNVINVSKEIYQPFGIINNLLDAPLMLLFLVFFSISAKMTKRIYATLLIFIGFEVVVLAVFGFNITTLKIILGPDIIIILIISFIFFLRNVRLAITNSKTLGKAVMISSVLLSYCIFGLAYIFFYLIKSTEYREDAELIYFLVIILSSLLMSIGIVIENKRIKKLDELKHTRKELAIIYGEKEITPGKDSRFFGLRNTR